MRNQADREVSVAIDRHPLRAFAAVLALAALARTGCGTEIPDDGTADGDALTFPVRCRPGPRRCTGQQPQTCNASGFWQNDGAACGVCNVCTPTSVRCLTATNGTACNDGNACTRADSCQGGACVGSNPVV